MSQVIKIEGMSEISSNHIGAKTWKRLSPNQKKAIIRNRKNARSLLKEFKNRKF